nr:beta-1,3-galactosyltransferase 6 [Hydra vulgaris]
MITSRKLKFILVQKWSPFGLIILNIFLLGIYLRCIMQSNCTQNVNKLKSYNMIAKRNINNGATNCFLLVFVISSPSGFLRRKTIRETWLQSDIYSEKQVCRKFVVGTKNLSPVLIAELYSEQNINQDMLFLNDLVDSYHSLTTKLLQTIIWVSNNIKSVYVMKVDDDSFVRLDILIEDLKKKSTLSRVYWGYFRGDSNVKTTGEWAENNWILSDHYLPYALGGGYLISYDLIEYLAAIHDMLQLYNSEDVSLGVWLAPLKLNRIHDIRFDTEFKSRGCSNRHVVSHKQKPEDMYEKHRELQYKNRLCKKETELIMTFDYNWNVRPSKCCKRVPLSALSNLTSSIYDKII